MVSLPTIHNADVDLSLICRSLYSMEVTITHRLLQLRLLEKHDVDTILPNTSLPPATSGESLMVNGMDLLGRPRSRTDG